MAFSKIKPRDFTNFNAAETVLLLFVFFSYGFVKMLNHDMVIAGVEDIMANTSYASGWISAMVNMPYIFTAIILRYYQNKFMDVHRIWLIFLAMVTGALGVGFLPNVYLKIASVSLIGIGAGCCQMAIMSLTAQYPNIVIHTYIVGDASGRLFTAPIYTVLTTYFCIQPQVVFVTTSVLSVIFPLYYHLILNKLPDHSHELVGRREREEITDDEQDTKIKETSQYENIPWSVKIDLIYQSFPRYFADFLGLSFQTLFLQSFFTTLVFTNAPFKPSEHYLYYMMTLFGGNVLGGVFAGYLCDNKDQDKKSHIPSTNMKSWIVIGFGLCNVSVLFIAIWYRNMPNVWVVMLLAFSAGLFSGFAYVFAISPVSEKQYHIVFTRSGTVVIQGIASLMAAMLAVLLEPMIRQRCFEVTHTREYCIARYIGVGRKSCYSTD